MAATRMEMVRTIIFVLVAAIMWEGGMAKSGCSNLIVSLSPCMDYVMGSNKSPSSKCCKEIDKTVKSQPQCLCEVINGGGSLFGISMNKAQISTLPKSCDIEVPPNTKCDAAPATSPIGKEKSSSAPTSSESSTSGSGSDGEKKSSAGNSTKLPFLLLFLVLFIASYASTVRVI